MMYTTVEKFGIIELFNVFERSLFKAAFIWSEIQQKPRILWNIITH